MLLSLIVFSVLGLFLGLMGPNYPSRKEAGGPGSFSLLWFPRWGFLPTAACLSWKSVCVPAVLVVGLEGRLDSHQFDGKILLFLLPLCLVSV